jgi:CysZ protein
MINNILKGIQGYTGALALISKLKLWKYFFIPIIISIITASLIALSAYGLSDNIGNFIAKIWPWDFGKDTFTWISTFIGVIVVVVIGLVLYKHIIMALSAPFMSPVSEKIEAHLCGIELHNHRQTSFRQQLWRGIRINFRNLGKELLITVPLLLLKFIPVVNIFSIILLIMVQAYYAGFGNIAIGNGLVFILFLIIPIVGVILVLPMSVTAASITTVELLKKDALLNTTKPLV